MVGLIGSSSPLVKGPHWPKWLDCGPGRIGASNVTKELQTRVMDNVSKWWLVSASVNLFVTNAGRPNTTNRMKGYHSETQFTMKLGKKIHHIFNSNKL